MKNVNTIHCGLMIILLTDFDRTANVFQRKAFNIAQMTTPLHICKSRIPVRQCKKFYRG